MYTDTLSLKSLKYIFTLLNKNVVKFVQVAARSLRLNRESFHGHIGTLLLLLGVLNGTLHQGTIVFLLLNFLYTVRSNHGNSKDLRQKHCLTILCTRRISILLHVGGFSIKWKATENTVACK